MMLLFEAKGPPSLVRAPGGGGALRETLSKQFNNVLLM